MNCSRWMVGFETCHICFAPKTLPHVGHEIFDKLPVSAVFCPGLERRCPEYCYFGAHLWDRLSVPQEVRRILCLRSMFWADFRKWRKGLESRGLVKTAGQLLSGNSLKAEIMFCALSTRRVWCICQTYVNFSSCVLPFPLVLYQCPPDDERVRGTFHQSAKLHQGLGRSTLTALPMLNVLNGVCVCRRNSFAECEFTSSDVGPGWDPSRWSGHFPAVFWQMAPWGHRFFSDSWCHQEDLHVFWTDVWSWADPNICAEPEGQAEVTVKNPIDTQVARQDSERCINCPGVLEKSGQHGVQRWNTRQQEGAAWQCTLWSHGNQIRGVTVRMVAQDLE